MALSSFLLRRPLPFLPTLLNVRMQQPFFSSHPFSTSSPPLQQTLGLVDSPNPSSSLSSRMSFVFEQLDALHRDRQDKDDALQRIRAWRHSKQLRENPQEPPAGPAGDSAEMNGLKEEEGAGSVFRREVELVHPWPEWIELMERLLQQNYFDHRRISEDRMVENVPGVDLSGVRVDEVGLELTRDWSAVCTAVENFGKDRFDILKSLSRKDLEILVGHGCPSADGKVVYSAKLLRKHAHVNEGDVCSACSLRSTCKRGFLVLPKEDEARTLDVMRVLLTFAFDAINKSVKNEPLMKMKSVKTVIRKLLHEIGKLCAVPIDPNLPRPIIKKAVPKVRQPPPPPKKRVGRDDVEMKKGDWLCPKCDFMNFAKNVVCLQCDAKRPKRQLLPGEWECPQCNFLNYRRNMTCFHCECKRPPDDYIDSQVNTKQHDPQTACSRGVRIPNVADSWNLDFDDNESDGADVAAFEFADPPRVGEGSRLGGAPDEGQGFNDDFIENGEKSRIYERRCFSESNKNRTHGPKTGFDDFDDEDDVDNYEIVPNGEQVNRISHRNFSKFQNASDSEEFDSTDSSLKASKNVRTSFSDSEDGMQDSDSDVDLSGLSYWKSSKQGNRSLPLHSDQEDESDYDNMGRAFSGNPRENSQQRSNKHGVGRNKASEHDIRQNIREFPRDNVRGFRRPLRGDRFSYNRLKNDTVSNRDDFIESSRLYRGEKSQTSIRPLRGKRFGYNQHRNSNQFDDKSREFDDRPRRRIIER